MRPHERLHVWLASVAPGLLSWPRVAAAVAIAAASWIAWAPTARTLFAPPSSAVWELTETFNNGAVAAPQRVDVNGFKACADGWCLDPGKSGTLIYQFTADHDVRSAVLWNNRPPGGANRVSISVDGGKSYRTLTENSTYAAGRLELGGGAGSGQAALLKFEASNPSPNEFLAIDQLILDSRGAWMYDLPRAVLWMIVSFGMAAVVVCRRWPIALSTVLILALAASFRYETAVGLLNTPLDPDAFYYRVYAGDMRLFSETGFFSGRFSFREPGYIVVLHLFTRLFGSADFVVRLLTVLLSTASVWAIMRVVRALWGVSAGQAVGLLVALNAPLIAESPRGLRLELELLLCMAFFGLAFVRNWGARWPGATLAMGIVGAALALTRSTYVPIVLVLGAYAVYRRAGLQAAVGAAFILAAVVAAGVVPHRYALYKLHGDPYWDTTQYARWNANYEFAGRPGYPTKDEFQKDPLRGPRITYNEFMFGLHTPGEVLTSTIRGYWKLYRNMEIRPWGVENFNVRKTVNAIFQIIAAAGMLIALWKREYLWIPFAFLVFEFPVAFLYDRELTEIYRHSYTAFPLVLFAAVLTVVTLHGTVMASTR